jgi:hypothetical protein
VVLLFQNLASAGIDFEQRSIPCHKEFLPWRFLNGSVKNPFTLIVFDTMLK